MAFLKNLNPWKKKPGKLEKAFGESANDFTHGRPLRAYTKDGQWADFSTEDLVGRDLNQFEGWSCGAGAQNICIDMDGRVYAATCHVGGYYGNVFSEFTIPTSWITCPVKRCPCGADLFIPKFKNSKETLRKTFGRETEFEKQSPTEDFEIVALERTHFSRHKQIYWEIGRRCNYSCSYCGPNHHSKVDPHRSLEELMTATDGIFKEFSKGDLVNFIITGGEPTVNPALMPWMQYIHSKGHRLSVHSNGSRNAEYYRELIKLSDLNLSVHFEYWNETKLLSVVEAVLDEKVKANNINVGHLELKIMMPPERYLETLSLEASLLAMPEFKNFCTWSIVPIRMGKRLEEVLGTYEEKHQALFGDRQ